MAKSGHKRSSRMRAFSFFSGALGMDLGLENSGLEICLASEIDKHCIQTIRENRPGLPLVGDISEHSAASLLEAAGFSKREKPDIIVGGPPCQAFSTAGRRQGFGDSRGNVFLKFIEVIAEIRPKYAIIENVRGLMSAPLKHRAHNERGSGSPPLTPEEQPGGALRHIIELLEAEEYGVSFNLYNAANFGSPQIRERVVMICSRDGSELPYLRPTHAEGGGFGLKRWKTFRDAVLDLKNPAEECLAFPEARLKYYRLLKDGQYWKHLPERLQREALGKAYYSGGGKTGFLRRLAWDKPAPTLVTDPTMPATDLAHPEEDRPLSVAEYARIQEFPDHWKFSGSVKDKYRQIGNAVPSGLGAAIGRLIVEHENGIRAPRPAGFPYSRYKNTDHVSWRRSTDLAFT